MKNKKNIRLIVLPFIILAIWYLFPSDNRVIERQVYKIAKNLSFSEGENSIQSVMKIKSIMQYFAKEVKITAIFEDETKTKDLVKQEIQQNFLIYSRNAKPIKVKIKDLKVIVQDSEATANFTALVERKKNNEEIYDAQQIKTEWIKLDSDWLLKSASNVKILY